MHLRIHPRIPQPTHRCPPSILRITSTSPTTPPRLTTNRIPTSIKPSPTNKRPNQHKPNINTQQHRLPPIRHIPPLIQKQPKNPTDTVRKPRSKQTAYQREQVVKVRYRLRDDPRDDPDDQCDARPGTDRQPGPLRHVSRAAEDASTLR